MASPPVPPTPAAVKPPSAEAAQTPSASKTTPSSTSTTKGGRKARAPGTVKPPTPAQLRKAAETKDKADKKARDKEEKKQKALDELAAKLSAPRAAWDKPEVAEQSIFILDKLRECFNGGQIAGAATVKEDDWVKIHAAFVKTFDSKYGVGQIKARYDSMLKMYKEVDLIANISGMPFNPETGTADVGDLDIDHLSIAHPEIRKYVEGARGFPFYLEMKALVCGKVADMKLLKTSAQRAEESAARLAEQQKAKKAARSERKGERDQDADSSEECSGIDGVGVRGMAREGVDRRSEEIEHSDASKDIKTPSELGSDGGVPEQLEAIDDDSDTEQKPKVKATKTGRKSANGDGPQPKRFRPSAASLSGKSMLDKYEAIQQTKLDSQERSRAVQAETNRLHAAPGNLQLATAWASEVYKEGSDMKASFKAIHVLSTGDRADVWAGIPAKWREEWMDAEIERLANA